MSAQSPLCSGMEGAVKIDIPLRKEKPAAQRRTQIATQRKRLRFGKEEQRRERALTFKKVGASDT